MIEYTVTLKVSVRESSRGKMDKRRLALLIDELERKEDIHNVEIMDIKRLDNIG